MSTIDKEYNANNKIKKSVINKIFKKIKINKNYDIIDKQITYNAIQIETEQLLNREKMLFIINNIIIIGLVITIFRI